MKKNLEIIKSDLPSEALCLECLQLGTDTEALYVCADNTVVLILDKGTKGIDAFRLQPEVYSLATDTLIIKPEVYDINKGFTRKNSGISSIDIYKVLEAIKMANGTDYNQLIMSGKMTLVKRIHNLPKLPVELITEQAEKVLIGDVDRYFGKYKLFSTKESVVNYMLTENIALVYVYQATSASPICAYININGKIYMKLLKATLSYDNTTRLKLVTCIEDNRDYICVMSRELPYDVKSDQLIKELFDGRDTQNFYLTRNLTSYIMGKELLDLTANYKTLEDALDGFSDGIATLSTFRTPEGNIVLLSKCKRVITEANDDNEEEVEVVTFIHELKSNPKGYQDYTVTLDGECVTDFANFKAVADPEDAIRLLQKYQDNKLQKQEPTVKGF